MELHTKDPEIMKVVREAYARAGLTETDTLWAWNARIRITCDAVIMRSGASLFLDLVLQSLRVYSGREAKPPDWHWVPVIVRGEGKGARRPRRTAP